MISVSRAGKYSAKYRVDLHKIYQGVLTFRRRLTAISEWYSVATCCCSLISLISSAPFPTRNHPHPMQKIPKPPSNADEYFKCLSEKGSRLSLCDVRRLQAQVRPVLPPSLPARTAGSVLFRVRVFSLTISLSLSLKKALRSYETRRERDAL